MAGDYTRFRYNPLKNTTGVQMQQGRVLLDQDWNEYVQLQDRRWRAETVDIMGRAVFPVETPTAFEIQIVKGPPVNLSIGIGRMYVDGLLAENHGIDPTDPGKSGYDSILGELIGNSPVLYDKQPYFPNPPKLPSVTKQPQLVYLDVWERELTYLEEPGLIDQAVAVDTGTRTQTVWQVKVLDNTGNIDCSTPPFSVAAIAPSAGRLTTRAAGVFSSTDPCIVPANGGYRGSGNRCYRVEIHNPGAMGTAKFKWSRDNASVATAVTGVNAARDTLTVVLTKRDSVLRFQPNDWVEVTDDLCYFHGLPGEMAQVAAVDDVNITIQLKNPLPFGKFDATDLSRHTRVIRWDQHGTVRDPLGNKIVDVDANGGLIPVPAGTTIVLEDGIQITFSIDTAMPVHQFNAFDYWMFDARVIDASVEILTQAAPRGIQHHYAWLGFVTLPGGPVTSCRVPWPPEVGEGCDCTVCVTEKSHNGGSLTLQKAVEQVKEHGGGKICLGPGEYRIDTTVTISGAHGIRITGHGLPILAATDNLAGAPIMRIDEVSTHITVEDLAIAGGLGEGDRQPGLVLSNSSFVLVTRCLFAFGKLGVQIPNGRTLNPAIGLADSVTDTDIRGNFFNNVEVGISVVHSSNKQQVVMFLAIEDNKMVCTRAGVRLEQETEIVLFQEIRFARNYVESASGFELLGDGLDVTIEENALSITAGNSGLQHAGIICSGHDTRISNNQIFGADRTTDRTTDGDGIILQPSSSTSLSGSQVVGNQIHNLTGTGILIPVGTQLLQTIIAQNQLTDLGGGGIGMEIIQDDTSNAADLNIVGNLLERVVLIDPQPNDLHPARAAIQLVNASGANVSENTVLRVGSDSSRAALAGIALLSGSGVRIAGNRLADIGPAGAFEGSGITLSSLTDRLDVVDNEVRQAKTGRLDAKESIWTALSISGDKTIVASVRGNLLESFISVRVVQISAEGGVCVFNDNQCFLDNLPSSPDKKAAIVELAADAIIASGNFLSGPRGRKAMSVTPGLAKSLTVLGNITSGPIVVGPANAALPSQWIPLNVVI